MFKRGVLLSTLTIVVALACSAPAHADTISGSLTLTGCGGGDLGCPDATYSFVITNTTATLTIHIDSAPDTNNDHILGVNLGFTPSNNISNLALTSSPGASGLYDVFTTGSLSNGGCGVNSGAFVCAASSTGGILIADGDTLSWTWTYDSIDDSLIAAVGNVHIGANYDPHNGLIVSQTGATVPEPGTLTLLLGGLLGLGGLARRRRMKS